MTKKLLQLLGGPKNIRKIIVWLFSLCILAEILRGAYIGLHERYGHLYVTRAVVAYMEDHQFLWPQSWHDLDSYLKVALHDEWLSARLVKQYWSVAWDVNPVQLYHPGPCAQGTPIIYEIKRNTAKKGPWCFGDSTSPTDRALLVSLLKAGRIKMPAER